MSEDTAVVAESTKPKSEAVELKEVVKEGDKESAGDGNVDQGNASAPTQSSSLQTPDPDIPDRTPSEIVEDEKTEAKAGAILKGVLDAGDDVQRYFDSQLEAVNIQMCCFSLLGFCLVIVYNDHCFDFENTLRFTDNFEVCELAWYFKLAAWSFWLIFLWRLCVYYALLSEAKAYVWGFSSRFSAFIKSDLWKWFLLELIVNAFFPLPLKSDGGKLSTLFQALCFCRLYLILRFVRDSSSIWKERQKIENHFKDVNTSGAEFSVTWQTVFKITFLQNTILCVLLLFLFTLGFLSYIEWLVERETWVNGDTGEYWEAESNGGNAPPEDENWSQSQFRLITDCAWFMIVTMTTLGYGDMVPYSPYGKVFAAIAVLIGIIQTSLLVGVVTTKMNPTAFEKQVVTWMEREAVKTEQSQAAVRVIEVAWKVKKQNRMRVEKGQEQWTADELKKHIKTAIRPWVKRLFSARKHMFEIDKEWKAEEQSQKIARDLSRSLDNIEDKINLLLQQFRGSV
jgi:hypothetical protein